MSQSQRKVGGVRRAQVRLWKTGYVLRIALIGGVIALAALGARQPIASAIVAGVTLLACVVAARSTMRWDKNKRVVDLTPAQAPSIPRQYDPAHSEPWHSEPWRP